MLTSGEGCSCDSTNNRAAGVLSETLQLVVVSSGAAAADDFFFFFRGFRV